MLDPYLVLGVGRYDDDQTVKKAYRALSKQYHPDNNINNPNKEAAEERESSGAFTSTVPETRMSASRLVNETGVRSSGR